MELLMSLRLALAATTILALAAPTFAQEAPAAAPQAAASEEATPEEAKSPEVLAFEAKAAAFDLRLVQLQSELEAAIASAAGDQAKGMAEVEIILARYEPEIDAYAPEMEAFYDSQIAAADDPQREALINTKTQKSAFIRGMTSHVRKVAPQFIMTAAPAPATTEAPS
ncbi:hypothetical protein D3C72_1535050 [compost metagenome]